MEQVIEQIEERIKEVGFSGVVYARNEDDVVIKSAAGFANRAEEIKNNIHTSFGIASGCKVFTAIAICQLIERGLVSFQSTIGECFKVPFPHFDNEVTVHQLLTHTSGIQDYFDEETMDDYEALWLDTPAYTVTEPKDFLPLFQDGKMKFAPGERFAYNNAGFIVLGLIVEEITGESFTDYVAANIFSPCGMHDSGYFPLDALPKNTAKGYIDFEDGSWKTNVYSIPKVGGPDGGAYVTAPDMIKFWEGLINGKLVSKAIVHRLLTSHVHVKDNTYYGYGIWIEMNEDEVMKYYVMGYDPGVSFESAYYPSTDFMVAIPSNKEKGPYKLLKTLEEEWGMNE
ncbi:serine hydrolase domain-containing protein [Alkalihalobacillus sp. CinArs1]|uniref:serine hydrolase domain-containing protein n=1 Tax=Alkalihalobacillus sp. CinArs1 TaxID=2995314 RepID=UPI0022DD2105|nr:serine hydrolase [Alkalihalobacillus sp. CinArs1]